MMVRKKPTTMQAVMARVNDDLAEFIVRFWIWLVLALLSATCYFVLQRFQKADEDNEKFAKSVEQFSKSVDALTYATTTIKTEQASVRADVEDLKRWRREHEKEVSEKEKRLIRELADVKYSRK